MLIAQHHRLEPVSGLAVIEAQGIALLQRRAGPFPFPLSLHDRHAEHVQPHGGEAVLQPRPAFGHRPGFEHSGGRQALQAVSQNAARRAELIAPGAEAAHAVERLAQDQLGPGVAGDGEGPRHRIAHDQGPHVRLVRTLFTGLHISLYSNSRRGRGVTPTLALSDQMSEGLF